MRWSPTPGMLTHRSRGIDSSAAPLPSGWLPSRIIESLRVGPRHDCGRLPTSSDARAGGTTLDRRRAAVGSRSRAGRPIDGARRTDRRSTRRQAAGRRPTRNVGPWPSCCDADTRWRCGRYGDLTRFDVVRSSRVREYWHLDLGGEPRSSRRRSSRSRSRASRAAGAAPTRTREARRAPRPAVRATTPPRPDAMTHASAAAALPLRTGVVVDLTRLLPSAYATSLLVGLGADVVKVETRAAARPAAQPAVHGDGRVGAVRRPVPPASARSRST